MIALEGIEHLARISDLTGEQRESLGGFFEENPDIHIIDMEDGSFLTAELIGQGLPAMKLSFPFGEEVFKSCRPAVGRALYGLAADETGKGHYVLRWDDSLYTHEYVYTGGIDSWYIDLYDTVFLNDCNEYSL